MKVKRERRGDATITTLLSVPWRPDDPQSVIEVYAHDDGGVTLLERNHRGEETGRLSVVREVWDAIVANARESAPK